MRQHFGCALQSDFFRSNSGHVFATSEVGLTLLCCWLSRVLTTGFIQTWCSRIEWPSFGLCQQEFSFRQVAFWGAILSGKVVGLSWCKMMVRRHTSVGQKKRCSAYLFETGLCGHFLKYNGIFHMENSGRLSVRAPLTKSTNPNSSDNCV